ncbi:MAG: glycosyltransferase family A protein [Solirubrobacteraceae bacterium]
MSEVSVAIPVRDGGQLLERTLRALQGQTVGHELLICDSGSRDRSRELAREHGARVLEISPSLFSHGGTRNMLMRESRGAHVAFVTQDAAPANSGWLERLLGGFELDENVGIVYGPYVPRPGAAAPVRLDLERWFRSLAPEGAPRVDVLDEHERVHLSASALLGARGFFTDANACLARAAWERIPFREVPYAEDRVLAIDMLRGGFSKVYIPDAAVVHSHDYTAVQDLRRCFDEWRGLLEVYGWREPASPGRLARKLRGELGAAKRELEREGVPASERRATLVAAARHHVVRLAGAVLGSNADRLPGGIRRRLSLEGRASFLPLQLDQLTAPSRHDTTAND